jgi:hypothetical protein
MMDQNPEPRETGKGAKVMFEDEISKCKECGIPLYPQAMMKKLESKVFMVKEYAWPFHLCPSCRMKTQFASIISTSYGAQALTRIFPPLQGEGKGGDGEEKME